MAVVLEKIKVWAQVKDHESGQMVVELAITIPVALVLLLIVVNLFYYLDSCSRFDQLAPKAVVFSSMETSSEDPEEDCSAAIAEKLRNDMGSKGRISIDVQQEEATTVLGILGEKNTYTASLEYTPWPAPRTFKMAGFSTGKLFKLTRTLSLCVDSGSPEVLF